VRRLGAILEMILRQPRSIRGFTYGNHDEFVVTECHELVTNHEL
jgi:hypothetical protein